MAGAPRFLALLSPPPALRLLHRPSLLRLTRHHHNHRVSRAAAARHAHLLFPPSPSPRTLCVSPAKSLQSRRELHSQIQCAVDSLPRWGHAWPEWSAFMDSLYGLGYFDAAPSLEAQNDVVPGFPEELLRPAFSCLEFSRDRPNLLGMLSRREIEVVVHNSMPHLFKNGKDSALRMKQYLGGIVNNALDMGKASTVDLMRFILSYIGSVDFEGSIQYNRELLDSSVRNLLNELAKLSYGISDSNLSKTVQNQLPHRYGQTPRSFGQNIEMKRGDWICPRCNFMNFARNVKCLECEEARPKRQLTGAEWECPQCDFFNYGRNPTCIRCDCKRPGDVSIGSISIRSSSAVGDNNSINNPDLESRLAANEEKAQRWFSKVSQLGSSTDLNSAVSDDDFPEIMPLRKGVNRFVVSTRKTPLERRLSDAENQRALRNNDSELRMGGPNKSLDTKISRTLDEILGRSSTASESNDPITDSQKDAIADHTLTLSRSASQQSGTASRTNSPADMFAQKPENPKMEETRMVVPENNQYFSSSSSNQMAGLSGSSSTFPEKLSSETVNNDKEQAEKSERWFKKVAELHNVTDLASAISDEDFPEIMPMRKGENRFVVSKKKDRSLTSPVYKRRMAVEQSRNSDFVPFVPFPPDYFAKKDNQQPGGSDSSSNANNATANSVASDNPGNVRDGFAPAEGLEKMRSQQTSMESRKRVTSGETDIYGSNTAASFANRQEMSSQTSSQFGGSVQQTSHHISTGGWNTRTSGASMSESRISANEKLTPRNSTLTSPNPQASNGYTDKINTNAAARSMGSSQPSENVRDGWTGKSLEGSAVKEPDPLDMSEEAKAERWFKRVAQIKDISELSQIPDEDFPSIMPMRKGVNRFVVSKRKTPLERRLTNQQYRRNLPIVTSDPGKREDDNS